MAIVCAVASLEVLVYAEQDLRSTGYDCFECFVHSQHRQNVAGRMYAGAL